MDPEIKQRLLGYRQSIDNIDAALIHMLAERFRCTKDVGVLKAKHDLPPADPAREEYQIDRLGPGILHFIIAPGLKRLDHLEISLLQPVLKHP